MPNKDFTDRYFSEWQRDLMGEPHHWKRTAIDEYNYQREDKYRNELDILHRKNDRLERELDELEERMLEGIAATDLLLETLAKNKLLTFLVLKHPEIIEKLTKFAYDGSVLKRIMESENGN